MPFDILHFLNMHTKLIRIAPIFKSWVMSQFEFFFFEMLDR